MGSYYVWYLVNRWEGYGVAAYGFSRPQEHIDDAISESECSWMIPTWEVFMAAS